MNAGIRDDSLRITAAFLGVYAGVLAIQHGVFEILQGNVAPDGLMIRAIGAPCRPETVWHACYPALTVIPNLLVSGILAILAGLAVLIWAAAFVQRRRGGPILALLSLLILPVGGGFVPVFIGLVAAAAGGLLGAPAMPDGRGRRILAALWPWPLLLMAAWMPGSWLLGHFFGPAMLAASGLLFLVFDMGLPVLAVLSGFAAGRRPNLSPPSAGYFRSGLPYNRFGRGTRPLVIVQGLIFENKPQSGLTFNMYRFLERDYTVFVVLRRPGLPAGYTMKDMADDYAAMIREEFGRPVDVLGVSTGGSIVQHLAADHPDLVRRLVIHSSAHTLRDEARRLQLQIGRLAQQRQWRAANAVMLDFMFLRQGIMAYLAGPLVWLASGLMALSAPKDPHDLVVTVEAEDAHHFKDRLGEILAPTLVIAGAQDPFYTPALFQETAAGIPNARLVLYEKMGHPAAGKPFQREVLAFLKEA